MDLLEEEIMFGASKESSDDGPRADEQELGRPAGRRHQRTTQELQATGRSAFAREVLAQCCNCGPRGLALELGTLSLGPFHFSLHLVA